MIPGVVRSTAVERFLRYVTYDTRSKEHSSSFPSTATQLVLLRLLADELIALGLADVSFDEQGYVMASIPATSAKPAVPAIGLIAHVDTSPEMPGEKVRPIVHSGYDGRDLVLPDRPDTVLRLSDDSALADQMGTDIITAAGTTLLGADDKAGVAEIVGAAEFLMRHQEIPHGLIRIAFTPDEEIGQGTKHFDVARFGAFCAYTIDGGSRGELEYESFSADAMTVTFTGFNTHPGYARGRMTNAIKMASDFVAALPRDRLSPETTDEYEGYVHPYRMDASVERTSVKLLIRDFVTSGLEAKETLVKQLAAGIAGRYPGSSVDILVEQSYRNMREVLEHHPQILDNAREAIRRSGLEPVERPIRGGTDGSRLSFMGLPTPNLFAGEHNFHSRLEWTSARDIEKAVETIVHLCCVWEESA
jgi:tripeptide aminopeptidase